MGRLTIPAGLVDENALAWLFNDFVNYVNIGISRFSSRFEYLHTADLVVNRRSAIEDMLGSGDTRWESNAHSYHDEVQFNEVCIE